MLSTGQSWRVDSTGCGFTLEPASVKRLETYEARGSFVVKEPKLAGCVFAYFTLPFLDAGEEATNRWLSDPMCPD